MATPTANSVALTGNAFIDGLTQGSAWQFGAGPRVITYSFNLNDNPNGGTWSQYAALQDAVDRAFAIWAQYIDVTFQSLGIGGAYNTSAADIAVILTGDELLGDGILAASIFPDNVLGDALRQASEETPYPKPEGDIVLSNYDPTFTQLGTDSLGMTVLLHEIAHALGLKHSDDDGGNGRPTFTQLGIAAYDTLPYTMMGGTGLELYDYVRTPQVLDVFAMQHIYGANTSFNVGNDIHYLTNAAKNVIWDAGGIDTIDASQMPFGSPTVINLNPGNPSGAGNFAVTIIGYDVVIENATGSRWNDQIIGNHVDNVLRGGIGNDTLEGGPGDDHLYGEADADVLKGGPGNDTYYEPDFLDTILEDTASGGSGVDTIHIYDTSGFALPAGIENLVTYESSRASNFVGNDLDNTFTLPSTTQSVRGGRGNDRYVVANISTQIIENPNEGTDTVVASANYRLGDNVENLQLTEGANGFWNFVIADGSSVANLIEGNPHSNAIAGKGGDDRLFGFEGNDGLDGGNGSDHIDGGAGIDTMIGGAGDDTFVVDSVLPSTWLSIVGAPNDGADTTSSFLQFSGASRLQGTNRDDRTQDGSIDYLELFFRSEDLSGPSVPLAISTERLGENLRPGFFDDTRSAWTFNVTDHYGLALSGSASYGQDLVGWFEISTIEFDYSGPTPQLTNLVMSFELRDGDFRAQHGFVQINGAPIGEPVIEDVNEGTDTVLASVDYILPRNVEHLTLTGMQALRGEGNNDSNTILGNANHNRLAGHGGDDTLDGGDGWDTAVYAGASHQYAMLDYQGTVRIVDRVHDRDGIDTIRNIEQAHFGVDGVTSVFTAADIFTPLEYIASYADLMGGFGANAQLGYEHFVEGGGSFAMRSATFDGLAYLASQPDLIAGYGLDRDAATSHYIQSGRNEGRTVTFNGLEYLASYSDLINSFGVNEDLGTTHYLSAGRNEGRTVTFRGLEYLASNPDLMAGFGDNFELATIHYISSGRFEGRVSSFHALEYIASYNDLIQGIGVNVNAGALHYINSGRHEGRTEHFDAAQYLANYPDLAAGFGGNHELAAIHYIQSGFHEGRTDQPGN